MSLDTGGGPSRGSSQDLWPKWMWIAVPVLVIVVVAALWWALLSPPKSSPPAPTATPTVRIIQTQPTQGPTVQGTLAPTQQLLPTVQTLPTLPTFTPTIVAAAATPTGEPTAAPAVSLSVGATASVNAGAGLNMRSGAGTGNPRIKTLPKDSIVEIIGGPKDANDYTWWQVRDETGTTGWVVEEYLDPQ
jgi:hypothetical protein